MIYVLTTDALSRPYWAWKETSVLTPVFEYKTLDILNQADCQPEFALIVKNVWIWWIRTGNKGK